METVITQTAELHNRTDLSRSVAKTDPWLTEGILPGMRAVWDLVQNGEDQAVLVLSMYDASGYASDRFAPAELTDETQVRQRFQRLIRELGQSGRIARIPIGDATVSGARLDELRAALQRLNPKLLKFNNRVELDPNGMFRVRDFVVEVSQPVAGQAKAIIEEAGFAIRGTPLSQREGIMEALAEIVRAHRQSDDAKPRFAVWFRLDDPLDVHLLEIADDAYDPGDGSLEGIAMGAGAAIAQARYMIVYLAPPSELEKAFTVNPHHPVVQALQTRDCRLVYPAGSEGWAALQREFPQLQATTCEFQRS